MDEIQQLREAKAFAERWANKGYEKGEGQKFWIDLLQDVLGVDDVVQKCKFEMLASNGGFIDASAHTALDAAVEQAYGVNFAGDEEKIVGHLFGLYEELTHK